MKKFSTKLEKVESFENPKVLAQFDSNTNTILYKDDVTEYFMAHESYHAEEMDKIGFEEYNKGAALKGVKEDDYTVENWLNLYRKEKYVYNQINKNVKKHNLNGQEIWHSWAYIEEIKFSLTELNIKIPK